MNAELVSLKDARVDRDTRVRARIEATIAESVARFGVEMQAWMEWTVMPGDKRGDIAEYLASEITHRYNPIAKQFTALYDVIELYVAAAHERGEDLGMAVLKALTVMMADPRYIGIAVHIAREQVIASRDGVGTQLAESIRRNSPSCIDAARDRLVEHYQGLRKK